MRILTVMFVTAVCFLFLLKLKWPKNKNIYDVTFERYGHETLKLARDFEKDLSRFNIIKHTFRNTAYSKTIRIRFTMLYQ